MSELKICYLYPDVLNQFSDGGNITCIVKRLEWRGIKADVTGVSVGEKLNVNDFDLFFIGGGQDFEKGIMIEDLMTGKGAEIKKAVEDEKVFLAVSNGYQILGNYYKTANGTQYDLTGAVNFHTIGQTDRMTGNFCFEMPELNNLKVVAFENHGGRTYLGDNVRPMGTVLVGNGNNGEDKTEGARYKNVYASYGHGPLLSKNPALADEILSVALQRKYGQKIELKKLDDEYELKANKAILTRLGL